MLNHKALKIAICSTGLILGSIAFQPISAMENLNNSVFISSNPTNKDIASENLLRAMSLVDKTLSAYFDPQTFEMRRFYNPFTKEKSEERASVWMYSAGIEAVNAILSALKANKSVADKKVYKSNIEKYEKLLSKFYDNVDYYLGTFELTSYTQTKTWSVYAVDRVSEKGKAKVTGIYNVYDDQMWLLRELLHSYKLTGNKDYLKKAEYLTDYALDGWDTTLDANGNENGGITWGPGYTTKHACSNGPLISSLVWLHTIYQGKNDQINRSFIDPNDSKTRRIKKESKEQYYLNFAKEIYDWQQDKLKVKNGLYFDMLGGCDPDCKIQYEEVGNTKYRANTKLTEAVGRFYSYNSGSMLSGAVDLFLATKDQKYKTEAIEMAENSFAYFAKKDKEIPNFYSFETDGFNNWFNGILLRGYKELASENPEAKSYLNAFQKNLDYGYKNYSINGFLPTNLLTGWNPENRAKGVEGMFMFSFAGQYAMLAEYAFTD
ncbi:hydrolase [Sphingobacterium cellulitidis]|uniref:glycoside hydrolase family 76 protein n=1 Tax=Sphingobacterium cellulitidis TaxID=1768011 RepID=UPI000B943FBB|nr:glycoside hydrolase family 76 protein [Sphingobacterium cellulitidis]OYD44749.1 hydrolase [Sphingobacterium cellulitidis]